MSSLTLKKVRQFIKKAANAVLLIDRHLNPENDTCIEKKFEKVNEQFVSVNGRIDDVNARITALEKYIDTRFDAYTKLVMASVRDVIALEFDKHYEDKMEEEQLPLQFDRDICRAQADRKSVV